MDVKAWRPRRSCCPRTASSAVVRKSSLQWRSPPGVAFSPIKYFSWTVLRACSSRPCLFLSSLPPRNEGLVEGKFSTLSVNEFVNQELGLFETLEDEYGGVIIDTKRFPLSVNAFVSALRASLSIWKGKGKRGVWLKLPIEHAILVPITIKEGFSYHHAEPTYIMLTYWLSDGACMLPPNASHQIGVGAFVISDNKEVLTVQEKYGVLGGSQIWKIPTGLIHQSEDIFTGVVREVKEETGIDTKFLEVLAFRHEHHVLFDKSDLFFLCSLKPLSSHIVIEDREIQAAQWMPLQEFITQPFYQQRDILKMFDICIAHFEKRYKGFSAFRCAVNARSTHHIYITMIEIYINLCPQRSMYYYARFLRCSKSASFTSKLLLRCMFT